MCTDLEPLKVKVPLIFSGIGGFPARMKGRYLSPYLPCTKMVERSLPLWVVAWNELNKVFVPASRSLLVVDEGRSSLDCSADCMVE